MRSSVWLVLTSGIALSTFALTARAEPPAAPASAETPPEPPRPDEERARLAFAEGRNLAAEGRYVKACKAFEESLSIVEGVGTLYHLADCYEKLGKTASAQRTFLRAADLAEKASQRERAHAARARAEALEPELSRLLVQVASSDTGIQVESDDQPLDPGAAIAVDPGLHRLTATVRGKRPWSTTVEVPSDPVVVTVIVPALEKLPPKAPKQQKRVPAKRRALPPQVLTRTPKASSATQEHVAIVLGCTGIASLVTGAVFALQYKASNDEAKAICPSGLRCTREDIDAHQELVENARNARTWSYVGFGAGAAMLGGATILYLTSRGNAQESNIGASAAIGADGSWGAAVRGRF